MTCLDRAAESMTELIEPSGAVSEAEAERFLQILKARIRKASVFVVSGSLPDGTDPSLYKRTAEEVAREFGLVPLDDLLNRSAELAGK